MWRPGPVAVEDAMQHLAGAAALLFATPCSAAAETPDVPDHTTCRRPEYPRESLRRLEDGISLLGFLIRADGGVADSVLNSSGYAYLDQAAKNALRKRHALRKRDGGRGRRGAGTPVVPEGGRTGRRARRPAPETREVARVNRLYGQLVSQFFRIARSSLPDSVRSASVHGPVPDVPGLNSEAPPPQCRRPATRWACRR